MTRPVLARTALWAASVSIFATWVAEPARAANPDPLTIKCGSKPRDGCQAASTLNGDWTIPAFVPEPEPAPTETLANALDAAYRTEPSLQAQRYQLRAADESYAQALAELRPTGTLQLTGNYTKTVPGRVTQAGRFLATSPIITSNNLNAQLTVTQPVITGGKAQADRAGALAEVAAGREGLRGAEGDILLKVVTAYANVRRDEATRRLYAANLRQLEGTLEEVKARKAAGELTRTDIALAENQLEAVESTYNSALEQVETDRATYAALVGHDAGVLAPPPPLPGLPESIDAAFAIAEETSPDLAKAIESERQSRARIASARAAGRPTLSIVGGAELTGNALPYYLYNQDQTFTGQAVLTVPLFAGGAIASQVAQAEDNNSSDRLGIEYARRQMVESIVGAWNMIVTARRNVRVSETQVATGRIYDEGTYAEYRAGLRSTFDVLYAHSTRRDAEIALVSAQHDLYIGEATLLRALGMLEARSLLTGSGLYDPAVNFDRAARRDALPLEGVVRKIDALGEGPPRQHGLEQPPLGAGTPALVPAPPQPAAAADALPLARHLPTIPLPGTTGVPQPDRSLDRP